MHLLFVVHRLDRIDLCHDFLTVFWCPCSLFFLEKIIIFLMLQKSEKKPSENWVGESVYYWFVSQKSSINGGVFSFQHPHGLNWYSIAAYRPVVASFEPWCLAMHPSQSEKSGCVWKPIMMPLAMIRIATCKNTGTTSVTHFLHISIFVRKRNSFYYILSTLSSKPRNPPPKKKKNANQTLMFQGNMVVQKHQSHTEESYFDSCGMHTVEFHGTWQMQTILVVSTLDDTGI